MVCDYQTHPYYIYWLGKGELNVYLNRAAVL